MFMNFDEAKHTLLRTGSLTLLTRTIKFGPDGEVISDTITDHVNGRTYPTPKR